MNQNMTIVHLALKALSGVCDGAASEDGQGFNGVDTGFGKQLAAQSTISMKQAASALKMLKKYSRQLQGFGITLPKTVEDTETQKSVSINYNNDWLVVRFNHIPGTETRNAMKAITGWKYCPEKNNAWVLPIRTAESKTAAWHVIEQFYIAEINGVNMFEAEQQQLAKQEIENEVYAF